MGTGYTRNDTGNNIADGNVINASDLDGEFDAVESAFNGSTGHSHDGTTGEGPQIDTAGIADDAVTGDKIDSTTTVTAASFVGPVTGNVTGNLTGDVTGNADTATALETSRTISLTGDVTGSASFNGTANASITATIADDSHNHVVSNIDGIAEYIQDTAGAMFSGNTESGITATYQDADGTIDLNVNDPTITLTGAVTGSATMTNLGNVSIATTATADPTLTINGDASGSATFTNLGNATLTLSLAADSVGASEIAANAVGASEINVSGNGSSGQYLISDGDGSMSWTTLSIPDAVPAGTVMLFVQSSAPTGWTKSTTHNNKALRVVSGTVSSGGNAAFTTAFASYTPSGNVSVAGSVSMSGNIGNTTLSINQIPSHRHNYASGNTEETNSNFPGPATQNVTNNGAAYNANSGATQYAGGGGSHNHGHNLSGSLTVNSSNFSGAAKDLAVQYVDVIIATKN